MIMKEFYGGVSLAARISFMVKSENEEKATDIVFDDIEGMQLVLKDGSKLEITEIDWGLIEEANRGNVSQSHISDFDIEEER
jgi:hypothetical protein